MVVMVPKVILVLVASMVMAVLVVVRVVNKKD